ncbi:hypothetical protein ACJX0J_015122, partial [Zea mays]
CRQDAAAVHVVKYEALTSNSYGLTTCLKILFTIQIFSVFGDNFDKFLYFFEDVRKKERILTTKNPIENPEILCGRYGMKKNDKEIHEDEASNPYTILRVWYTWNHMEVKKFEGLN